MKKGFVLITLAVLCTALCFSQATTLTRKLVNGKYGFGYPSLTKKDGNGYPLIEALVIPARYDETSNVTFADEFEGLAGVKLDGKWGFIDATGATKIPFKYDDAGYFHESLALVAQNGKYGFINKSGATLVPLKYEEAHTFESGLAYVELAGKSGFINKSGVVIIPLKYDKQTDAAYKKCAHCGSLYSFEKGKAVVILNGKCGIIDTKGIFAECAEEAVDSSTFTGVVNGAKNHWGTNPGAAIKGSCESKMDIKQITLNGKDITGLISYENKMMYIGFSRLKAGDKVAIKIVHKKGVSFQLFGDQGFDLK